MGSATPAGRHAVVVDRGAAMIERVNILQATRRAMHRALETVGPAGRTAPWSTRCRLETGLPEPRV